MSQVFEWYERQYWELSANLSEKCTSATLLDGAQKKLKISEIKTGLDEAEILIRKMNLEARSLHSGVKAMLLQKLRAYKYKSDLNNLKTEVKKITSTNAQATRDELLESGMADAPVDSPDLIKTMLETKKLGVLISQELLQQDQAILDINNAVSADQRSGLLQSTERLNQSSERRKAMLETEELGISILDDLHQQRQSLLHAYNKLHGVDDNIGDGKNLDCHVKDNGQEQVDHWHNNCCSGCCNYFGSLFKRMH